MTLLERNIDYINSLLGEANVTTGDKTTKLILQTLALIAGGELVSTAVEKFKSLFNKEQDKANTIVSKLSENEKNAKKLNPKNVSKSDAFSVQRNAFNKYGFNFLNKWEIDFGTNEAISISDFSESLEMLKYLTNEVSLPSIEIETLNNPLFHSKNPDISNVTPGDFSVSIWLDSDMIIYKGIMSVINEMKDFDNGRYGYREDYQFPEIKVKIQNNLNDSEFDNLIIFENCIITNVSDISIIKGPSDVKNLTLTFQYDRVDYRI